MITRRSFLRLLGLGAVAVSPVGIAIEGAVSPIRDNCLGSLYAMTGQLNCVRTEMVIARGLGMTPHEFRSLSDDDIAAMMAFGIITKKIKSYENRERL